VTPILAQLGALRWPNIYQNLDAEDLLIAAEN
jgi:hypothetical protein